MLEPLNKKLDKQARLCGALAKSLRFAELLPDDWNDWPVHVRQVCRAGTYRTPRGTIAGTWNGKRLTGRHVAPLPVRYALIVGAGGRQHRVTLDELETLKRETDNA